MGNNGAKFRAVQIHNEVNCKSVEVQLAKNVTLCCKAAALNILVYNNSVRDEKNVAYEEKNVKHLNISDYKICTYTDYAEGVFDSIIQKPAISAQYTTGIISHLSEDFPFPIPFICFCGTISLYEVIADLSSVIHCTAHTLKGNVIGTCGRGMVNLYYSLRGFKIIPFIIDNMMKYNSGLVVTGHSIGGAVALLLISELLIDYPELFDADPVHLITFGSPRVFTPSTATFIHNLIKSKPNLNFIRLVNRHDIISMLPSSKSQSLVHIGTAYYLGRKGIEIFSGEADVNFPLDRQGMMGRIAQFASNKALCHRMDSMCGYLPRLVKLSLSVLRANLSEAKALIALLQSVGHMEHLQLISLRASIKGIQNILSGKSFKTVDCKIWTNMTHPDFCYPETALEALKNKSRFGIAIGGGGLSAACFALGWVRALQILGLLKKAGYVSTVGSSSWVNIPMTFGSRKISLEEFLGPYVAPNECIEATVQRSVAAGHGRVLSDSDLTSSSLTEQARRFSFSPYLKQTSRKVSSWCEAVGKSFLKPHGFKLAKWGIPELSHGAERDQVRAQTSGWVQERYTARDLQEHPFPILNSAVFVGGMRGCLPAEFTPLYYGVIPYYESASGQGDGQAVGGCLIEPHGFTARPDPLDLRLQLAESSKGPGCSVEVRLPRPEVTVTMQEIAGMSSVSYFRTRDFSVFPTFNALYKGDTITSCERFQDGCGCDSTGIISLLRRKCRFVLACLPASAALLEEGGGEDVPLEDANRHSLGNLAGLFGRQASDRRVNKVTSESFNEQRKVFPSESWDQLLAALRSLARGRSTEHWN